MSISPNIWGPSAWAFIHLMTLSENDTITQERLKHYNTFYNTLTHLLPCAKCRNHLEKNLSEMSPITSVKNKEELFKWTVELHNKINTITGKKVENFDKMYKLWTDISLGKKDLNGKYCLSYYLKYIFAIILIIIIALIISNYFPKVLRKN
jgi:hypothetical protein